MPSFLINRDKHFSRQFNLKFKWMSRIGKSEKSRFIQKLSPFKRRDKKIKNEDCRFVLPTCWEWNWDELSCFLSLINLIRNPYFSFFSSPSILHPPARTMARKRQKGRKKKSDGKMLPTKENFYPFHINMKTEEIMEKEEKKIFTFKLFD